MSSNTNNNVVRPLGNFERAWQEAHDSDHHYNVAFSIRYKIPTNLILQPSTSSSVPTEETKNVISRIIYPILEKIILKEPVLTVAFADLHTSKPLFIKLSEIDLNRIVKFVIVNDDDDFVKLMEEEHTKKFNVQDSSIPLWRIIIGIKGTSTVKKGLNDWNFIFSFFFHHAPLDGRSTLVFYSEFNEFLSEMLSKKQDSSEELKSKITIPQEYTVPFPKPVEECIGQSTSSSSKSHKGHWLGDVEKSSIPDYTSKTLLYSIDPEELQSLLKQCRQHKTTITSLFNMAVLFSAYHHLIVASNQDSNMSESAKKLAPFDTISLNTCVNLRPYCTPELPWTQMGLYLFGSIYTHKYLKPDNDNTGPELDFWEMCKEFRKHLIEDIHHNSAKELGGFDGNLSSIIVTNMGKFPKYSLNMEGNSSDHDNKWEVEDLLFTQSAITFATALIIHVVSCGDKLGFTIVYQNGAINSKKMERFGEGIVKCLKLVAKNENVTLQDLV